MPGAAPDGGPLVFVTWPPNEGMPRRESAICIMYTYEAPDPHGRGVYAGVPLKSGAVWVKRRASGTILCAGIFVAAHRTRGA